MADIKQAAQWMKKGKKVKRPVYAGESYVYSYRGAVLYHSSFGGDDCFLELCVNDLLADDWEVVNGD